MSLVGDGEGLTQLARGSLDGEGLRDGTLMLMLERTPAPGVPTTSFLGDARGEGAALGSLTISLASTAVRLMFRPSSRASFSPASIAPCSFRFRVFASCSARPICPKPTLATQTRAQGLSYV